MTNPLRVFYTVLLISTVVKAQQECAERKQPNQVKCCEQKKPYYCLFQSIEQQTKDPKCHCNAKSTNGRELMCAWNGVHIRDDDNVWTVPCSGFEKPCEQKHVVTLVNNKKTKEQIKQDTITCAFPNGKSTIMYPLRYKVMKQVTGFEKVYCDMKNRDGSLMNDHDFYSNFLSCWLYDCEIRLRKPQKTITPGNGIVGNTWCYPPILYPDATLKYCSPYDLSSDVYSDTSNEAFLTQEDRGDNPPCVLPPFCEKDQEIDSNLFMVPLIGKKPDSSYCEVICPADYNIGVDKEKSPCRRRPTCGEGDKYKVMEFASEPKCLEWCNATESYFKLPEDRAKKDCNNIPVCSKGGGVPTPFSEENPFGLTDQGSVKCLERRDCLEGESKATHFCDLDEVVGGASEDEEGGGMNTTVIASLTAGAIILVILIVVIVVVVVVIIRRRRNRSLESREAMDSAVERPPTQRAFNITDTTEWKRVAQNNKAGESTMATVSQMTNILSKVEPQSKTQSMSKSKSKSKSLPKSKTKRKIGTAPTQTASNTRGGGRTTTLPTSTTKKTTENYEFKTGLADELKKPEERVPSAEPEPNAKTYDNLTFPTHLTETTNPEGGNTKMDSTQNKTKTKKKKQKQKEETHSS